MNINFISAIPRFRLNPLTPATHLNSIFFASNGGIAANNSSLGPSRFTLLEYIFAPFASNGDNIPDTYNIQDLAPGFYFAQIQDCLVEGCALIVEFDLRAEPEPIFLDTVITQANCEFNEEASACIQINGGTPPYSFNLSMINPINEDLSYALDDN